MVCGNLTDVLDASPSLTLMKDSRPKHQLYFHTPYGVINYQAIYCCHMRVELLVSSLPCFEGFSGYSVLPKFLILKFNSISVDILDRDDLKYLLLQV